MENWKQAGVAKPGPAPTDADAFDTGPGAVSGIVSGGRPGSGAADSDRARWGLPISDGAQSCAADSDVSDDDLVAAARRARENAYAPYSGFKVGAAVASEDGRVFSGCNVEIVSYGLTCCAERTAIFKAVSEGCRSFTRIAIVAGDHSPATPCGACRQVIQEFAPRARIIMEDLEGHRMEGTIQEYLPNAFGPCMEAK